MTSMPFRLLWFPLFAATVATTPAFAHILFLVRL